MSENEEESRLDRRTVLKGGAVGAAGLAGVGAVSAARDGVSWNGVPSVLEREDVVEELSETALLFRGLSVPESERAHLPRAESDVESFADADLAIVTPSHLPDRDQLLGLLTQSGTGVCVAGTGAGRDLLSVLYGLPRSKVKEFARTGTHPDARHDGLDISFGISVSAGSAYDEVTMLVPNRDGTYATSARGEVSTGLAGDDISAETLFVEQALAVYARSHLLRDVTPDADGFDCNAECLNYWKNCNGGELEVDIFAHQNEDFADIVYNHSCGLVPSRAQPESNCSDSGFSGRRTSEFDLECEPGPAAESVFDREPANEPDSTPYEFEIGTGGASITESFEVDDVEMDTGRDLQSDWMYWHMDVSSSSDIAEDTWEPQPSALVTYGQDDSQGSTIWDWNVYARFSRTYGTSREIEKSEYTVFNFPGCYDGGGGCAQMPVPCRD